jgi:hypothetical protein
LIPESDREYYLKKSDTECLEKGYKEYIPINFEPFVRKHALKLARSCDFDRIDDLGQVGRTELVSVAGRVDTTKPLGSQINYITRSVIGSMLAFIANADGAVAVNEHKYYSKEHSVTYENVDMSFVISGEDTPESLMVEKERRRVFKHMLTYRRDKLVYPATKMWDFCIMRVDPWSSRKMAEHLKLNYRTVSRQLLRLKDSFATYYKERENEKSNDSVASSTDV